MTEIKKDPGQDALAGQVSGVFDIAYIHVSRGDAQAGGSATVAIDQIGLNLDLPMDRLESHHGYRRRLRKRHIQLVPPRRPSDPISTTETHPDGTFIFTKEQEPEPDLRGSEKLTKRQFLIRVFSPAEPAKFGLTDPEENKVSQENPELKLAA